MVSQRDGAEKIITELHTARVSGELDSMCRLFAADGSFKIAGASADKPISIRADGIDSFRPWLSMMVKVFRVSDYALSSLVIEWPRAAVHWHANIYSKVTGVTVATELIDMIEIRDGRIVRYTEFFMPR